MSEIQKLQEVCASLREQLDRATLQVRDAEDCIQDLRDLLSEQPKESGRPFILGARRRLRDYEERYKKMRSQAPQFYCEKCHYRGPIEYPHPLFEGIETEFCLAHAKPV